MASRTLPVVKMFGNAAFMFILVQMFKLGATVASSKQNNSKGPFHSAYHSTMNETEAQDVMERSAKTKSSIFSLRSLLQRYNESPSTGVNSTNLNCQNLVQFYDEFLHRWVLTNEMLEFVADDVQSVIECAKEGDSILFQSHEVIKPKRTLIISKNLTLGTLQETKVASNGSQVPTSQKVRLTCPESGQLILAKSPSFTLIGVAIEDCNSTFSLIELDSDCNDAKPSQIIRMLDILIERNEFHGQGQILNSRASSCSHLEFDDVILQENLCYGSSCVSLLSSNTLRNIQLLRNHGSGNSSLDNSIFLALEGSTTNATNVTCERNLIRSFLVSSGTLNITNSHFSDNTIKQDGGAIHATMNSSLILTHSSFSSNEGGFGGAIHLTSSTGIVMHCNFFKNKAEIFAGAIFMQQYTYETISSCSFTNNSAGRDGGAIIMYRGTNGQISSCNFTNNMARIFGGAIYIVESVNETISHCIFANNIADNDGGAMRMQKCNEARISYCNFTHNSAQRNGGALDLYLSIMPILADSTFSSNEATNGGAVLLVNISNGLISNCNFISNTARSIGGALLVRENSTIALFNSNISSNEAGYGGALFVRISSFVNVSSCRLSNNSAINHGGAIHVFENSTVFLINSAFSDNEATYGGSVSIQYFSSGVASNCSFTYNTARSNGGAFDVFSNAMLNVTTSTFSNNEATQGGAVFLVNSSDGTVHNCNFTSNAARSYGGAFYMYNISTLTLSYSTLLNSEATYGGALYFEEFSSGMISQCYFTNNRAQHTGGSIDTKENSMVTCINSIFSSNEARSGGGMHLNSSHGTILNCTFKDNEATNYGGVFFAQRNSSLTLSDSFLARNKGEYGGALALQESSRGNVSNNICSNNVARVSSGVIYLGRRATLFMHSTRLHNNSAQNGGALYLEESSNGTIRNCTFTNSTATKDGGAICLQAHSTLTLSNSVLQRNKGIYGGALFVQDFSVVTSINTNFSNNNASLSGGVISLTRSSLLSFSTCFVLGSLANELGGALYLHSSNISLLSSNFNFNIAILGGALHGINVTMNITNSTFETNHARRSGGAIYIKNSSAILEETIIQSNEAMLNFGGICALEVSHLNASNLIVQSNSAGNLGGGVGIGNGSTILCYICIISNNKAFRGAGLYVYSNNSINVVAQLQDSRFENNSAQFYGGGMEFHAPFNRTINCNSSTAMCSHVALLNTEFLGNFANLLGGAILTTNASGILIDCKHRPRIRTFVSERFRSSSRSIHPERLCSSWIGNQILGNTSGADAGTYGQEFVLSIDETLNDVKLVGNSQTGYVLENVSSGKQLPKINVTIVDEFGVGPAPTMPRFFRARLSALNGLLRGEYPSTILDGSGSFIDVAISAHPGNYTLKVELDNASFDTINVTVIVRECRIGEAFISDLIACQECDALSYNFNVSESGSCTQCPSNGDCTRQYIIPKKGYWHKSPCHSTIQECLVKEACSYTNRQEALMNITSNSVDCKITNTTQKAYSDKLCNEGYEGLLCGSCKKSFGLSVRFLCLKCPKAILSLLTIFCITIYLLVAASFTIRGGLSLGFESQDDQSLSDQSSSEAQPSTGDSQINIEMVRMLVEGCITRKYSEEDEEESTNTSQTQRTTIQQENDFELTRWRAAELLKTIAVAATISVQWTDEMFGLFESSEYIGALTTIAISRPVDCIISSGSSVDRAIWRKLVTLFVPLVVMGILSFFWGLVSRKNGKGWVYFLKRCTLSVIAVVYISYLGLTRMAVRAFYCIDVYDSIDYSIPSKHKFWAIDTAIRCYGTDHSKIIAIGVLVLIVVTIFFPTFFGIVISTKRENLRRKNSWIFETCGFLFRAFKQKFAYWESVVMFRKACLSVIVVFSYPLGGDSQGLLVSVLLFFSLYLQLTLRPYREEFKILNHFESISLLVSGLTFTLGQFFAEGRCNDSTKTFLAILIIFGNSMFFLVLLLALFYTSMVHLRVILQCENIPLPVPPTWWNILKVYIYSRYTQWRQSLN